ncbi:MAG: glycosyltransferase [Polyangiales bacterium]
MRIVHVIPSYLPAVRYGGPMFSTQALCAALVSLGHQVQVVTTSIDGDGDSDVPHDEPVLLDGVEVRYFRTRHLRRLTWSSDMALGLWRILPGADVVHLHSVFLAPTTIAAAIARRYGIPYVMSPRGALVPEHIQAKNRAIKLAWLALLEQRNLRGAARLHVTSEAEYADAARVGLPIPPAAVVPNGVDVPHFGALKPPTAWLEDVTRTPYLLFVGRLNRTKGLDRLITSLEGTSFRLLLAGPDENGHHAELQALASARGVAEQVEFLGIVSGDDKAWLMKRARVLALTSYRESFGNVVVEALAAGTPVVVTPEVGAHDHVTRSRAGAVVDGDSAPSLRAALDLFWRDDARRAQAGERGRRYVTEHLSWRHAAELMLSHYRAMTDERVAEPRRAELQA